MEFTATTFTGLTLTTTVHHDVGVFTCDCCGMWRRGSRVFTDYADLVAAAQRHAEFHQWVAAYRASQLN